MPCCGWQTAHRTDTPAGPEAEMSLQSPWCCIQGWWGVCFVQLCGIRQPDDSAQMQAGRWRAPTWSSGRARRWGPRALRGRPSPQIEHGDVRFALQWTGLHQQAAAGCRIRHMPDGRWQLPWRPQVVGWWADQRGHKSHLSPKRVTPRPNRPRNRDLRAK